MKSDRQTMLIGYSLMALAILVQIQATVNIGGTPVRINAADIILVTLAPVLVVAFYTNLARLKEIAGPQLLILVVVASVSLSFSFFRGYEAISGLSTWAAIKYAGWYILLCYLALGALIAIRADSQSKERFVLGFIFFQVIVVIAFLVNVYAFRQWLFHVGGRLTGFAGNTNAMAFYLICGLAMALAYLGRTGLSRRCRIAVSLAAGLILAGILFTKSLAALIALVSVLLFALIIHVTTLRRLVQIFALGWVFWMAPQFIFSSESLVINVVHKVTGIVISAGTSDPKIRSEGRYDASVQVRMEGYLDAVDLWMKHPVLGAGLGVHLYRKKLEEKPKHPPLQIHNTGLWLLAESGLAGFLVMAVIYIVMFHKVWRLSRAPPGKLETEFWFPSGVLLILVGWGVMSLFHELMYQRFVWLFVGMVLTSPVESLRFRKWIPALNR